jgi:hypothetical protein
MGEKTPKKAAPSSTSTPASSDAGQAELQKAADKVSEQGYVGSVPDQTPNEEYTVEGVTKKARGEK